MYADLPLADIRPNPDQPRKHFDPDALAELAGSIAANGLLEPILVRPVDGSYVIIAGERRYRASTAAGLTAVPCRVMHLDERDAYVLSVAENVNRSDMTVMEEVDAFAQLVTYGKTHDEIATMFGKSVAYVDVRLSFRGLVDEAKALLTRGDIRPNLARYIAELEPGNQRTVINKWARGEFKHEIEATHFARSLAAAETEVGFFDVAEPTVEDREVHRAKAAAARRSASETERLMSALSHLADMSPAELAKLLGDELGGHVDRIERVTSAAQAARQNLRKAQAHAAAAQLAIREDVAS